MDLEINEVITKKEFYPMLVTFENGYLSNEFCTTPCKIYQNSDSSIKTVASNISDVVYCGKEQKENFGQSWVLARNKNTGKVRLIEVGSVALKPNLNLDTEIQVLKAVDDKEFAKKFGSKRSKRNVEQKEKLKVNINTVKQQMQNISVNITQEKIDLSTYLSNNDDFYVPKINRSATRVEDVYELLGILEEHEYDKILSEIENCELKTKLMPSIKNIIDIDSLTSHQKVLALYANTAITIYKDLIKDISKKFYEPCKVSHTLNSIALSNLRVDVDGKYSRPIPYKDKALCYAVVFMLLINNYKFPINDWITALKLPVSTLPSKISPTGALITNEGGQKSVVLKVPLSSRQIRRKSSKF